MRGTLRRRSFSTAPTVRKIRLTIFDRCTLTRSLSEGRCIYDDDMIDTVRYAYDSGHLIGSHSWNHLNLSEQSPETGTHAGFLTSGQDAHGHLPLVNEQMDKLDVALERIIGVTPAWMRPPNGSYNDVVLEVAALRGQSIVLWDFNAKETYGATPEEIKDEYAKLADQHPANALTLNIEWKESTV